MKINGNKIHKTTSICEIYARENRLLSIFLRILNPLIIGYRLELQFREYTIQFDKK